MNNFDDYNFNQINDTPIDTTDILYNIKTNKDLNTNDDIFETYWDFCDTHINLLQKALIEVQTLLIGNKISLGDHTKKIIKSVYLLSAAPILHFRLRLQKDSRFNSIYLPPTYNKNSIQTYTIIPENINDTVVDCINNYRVLITKNLYDLNILMADLFIGKKVYIKSHLSDYKFNQIVIDVEIDTQPSNIYRINTQFLLEDYNNYKYDQNICFS